MARPPRQKHRRYLLSLVGGFAQRALFRDLETFCGFIGYPRSGHTLIGSLLDAHPEAVLADELDAMRFLQAGFSRRQVFYLLLRNARAAAAGGRQRTGYHYRVPGQWQGRVKRLRVIGDKYGGVTETRLTFDPQLFESLAERLQLKIKFVHVLRNPYDIISTVHLRQRHTLDAAVERFFRLCQSVAYIKSKMPDDVFDLRHEAFLVEPKTVLSELCAFFRLATTEEYLDACASIVFRSPHQSRRDIVWPDGLIEAIAQRMAGFEFLAGYSFDS